MNECFLLSFRNFHDLKYNLFEAEIYVYFCCFLEMEIWQTLRKLEVYTNTLYIFIRSTGT